MNCIKDSESVILYTVKEKGLSVNEVLSSKLNISGRLLRKLEKDRLILLNQKKARLRQLTGPEDIITIIMDDERENNFPQKLPLDIIYEDFDLVILNKQPNIVVHPTKSHKDKTIANGLAYYFKKNEIKKKIRFVNRLDMNTSGVLVAAKNPFGHQQMALQFEEDKIEKRYLALVEGLVQKDTGVIDAPIGKDEENPLKNKVKEDGKKSITSYRVLKRYRKASLVELNIKTGRTHQIRVHLEYIGHPVIGDSLYNKPSDLINRQALHSYSLTFKPPRRDEIITIKADFPADMKRLIELLK